MTAIYLELVLTPTFYLDPLMGALYLRKGVSFSSLGDTCWEVNTQPTQPTSLPAYQPTSPTAPQPHQPHSPTAPQPPSPPAPQPPIPPHPPIPCAKRNNDSIINNSSINDNMIITNENISRISNNDNSIFRNIL